MNIVKRICGLENRQAYLSKLLNKKVSKLFQHFIDCGYCHRDVANFCEDWLKTYAQFRKVNDKIFSMSDDLPF